MHELKGWRHIFAMICINRAEADTINSGKLGQIMSDGNDIFVLQRRRRDRHQLVVAHPGLVTIARDRRLQIR